MFNAHFRAVLVVLALLVLIGCADDSGTTPTDGTDDRILLNQGGADLNARITLFPDGVDLPMDDDGSGQSVDQALSLRSTHSTTLAQGSLVLVLRAEVDPPLLDGVEMRATHVQIDENRAYVTYNREGETFLGGVEIFDLTDPTQPSILSQALFTDTDISAAYLYDGSLFLAAATEDESYSTPAILEVMELDESGLLTTTSVRIDLPSYVGTGVRVADANGDPLVFVTSGTGGPVPGGLSIYEASTLEFVRLEELDDARDVDVEGNSVVVMQGTPGRLSVFDAVSGLLLNSFSPGGANIAESKSTIDVVSDRIYMAAGDEGTKVVSLSSGDVLIEIPRITLADVDPSLTVTNAVSVSGELLLMGNGEAGVYVSQIDGDTLRSMGYVNFGTSANYVLARDNLIFVSSGEGGLKVIEAVYYNPAVGSFLSVCSTWDSRGVPSCLDDPCTLPDGLESRIEAGFPNRRDFPGDNPGYFTDSVAKEIVLTDTTTLSLCFYNDNTGWTNTLGYYTYSVDDPPVSPDDLADMTVIFPNASSTQGGGGLEMGDHINLGQFEAGTVVGFFLVAQGWHAGDVTSGRSIHYTDPSFNGEAAQQHVLLHDETSGAMVLSWEDVTRTSPRQQTDFNDVMVLIESSNPAAVNSSELPAL